MVRNDHLCISGSCADGSYICAGNFHSLLLFKTDEELKVVRGLVHRMVERAIALDGTCEQRSFAR